MNHKYIEANVKKFIGACGFAKGSNMFLSAPKLIRFSDLFFQNKNSGSISRKVFEMRIK